jgi:hypothetical protein
LVDTPASGAGDLTVVEVRVFFWAPILHKNPRKRVFAFLAFENPSSLSVSTAHPSRPMTAPTVGSNGA